MKNIELFVMNVIRTVEAKLKLSNRTINLLFLIYMLVVHSLYWLTSSHYPFVFILVVLLSLIVSQGLFKPWKRILSKAMDPDWDKTKLIITLPFVVLNWIAVFACLYMYGCVIDNNGVPIKGAWEHFYFSTVTLTTLGYGNLVPDDFLAQFLATVEAIVGFLGFAVLSGIVASIALKRIELK
ncbi:potassium channel family protein [Vibrio atypicus]|uniref:potassium channel family protein n=1 Tax=Vibrio atypicus TaxID=558271 RepID=UPI00135A99B5|nr:potassium channel family protein [Vibrio atypicus]